MATRRIRISPAGNQFDVLGESPVWCPQDGSIYWIDWAMNVIRRMRSRDGALTEWKMKEKVGSFALRQSRGAILAMQSGFHLFDFESADTTFIANPNPAGIRHGLNDGKCDRAGRFLGGIDRRSPRRAHQRFRTGFSFLPRWQSAQQESL